MYESIIKGLGKCTTPTNVFALLHVNKAALHKLNTIVKTWDNTMRDMVLVMCKTLNNVMCSQAAECFE